MRRPSRGPSRGKAGSVPLEFAAVLPVLIAMLIGVSEVTQLLRAKMKLNHAAGVLAKMVAQQTTAMTPGKTGTLGNLCTGAGLVLAPLNGAPFAAAIASVTTSAPPGGTGSATTSRDWESDTSCAGTATALGAAGAVSLATSAGLVPDAGDSAIVVRASYTYTAYTALLLAPSYTLSQVAYARPRTNTTIACSTC